MKRIIITLLGLIYSSVTYCQEIDMKRLEAVWAKKTPQTPMHMAIELYNQKLYFSMVPFVAEHIIQAETITPEFEKLIEEVVLKTGTNSLAGVDPKHLVRHQSPSLNLVLAFKLFQQEKYKDVAKLLHTFSPKHRFGSEALMMLGTSLQFLDQYSAAESKYELCVSTAGDLESKAKHERLKRYYAIIKESCQTHLARIAYKQKDYQRAVLQYEKISKNSYLWPYLLLERAWASYYLEDFNRSLGLLVTYRSPLLTSYFFPEAEVLTALSYHKLCLWDDVMKTIEQYHQVYKSRSDSLRGFLVANKDSDTYFLQLMLNPIESGEKLNPFIRNLITQIRKKVKFSVDLINYQASREELERWKLSFEKHKSPLSQSLARESQRSVSWRTTHLNHFIKQHMFGFINDIHRFSFELFNIQLEVMSNRRDLLYKNQTLISDRSRGSLDNVKRRTDQHFYQFTGEFWADELGDYSFGLQSNCELVSRIPANDKKKGVK